MPEIPENLQPVLAFIRKHQFWLALALIPCVLIPSLLAGQATLDGQIKAQRGRIRSKVAQIKGVEQKAPHPNDQWKTVVDAETERVRRETLEEWRTLWNSQADLRVWPRELGDPFIAQVTNLPPGGSLDFTARTRYQTDVRELVKQLPPRMGADEEMVTRAAAGDGTKKPERGRREFRLVWRPENQKQLYQSFDWEKLPDGRAATAQILHAQEELWVYGLLCDAIKRANKDAKTGFDAVIVEVLELAVGHPAVEESPGGQGQRLGRGTGVEWSGGVGQSQNRPKPAHPRFAGGGSRAGGFVPAAGPYDAAPPAADAAYREAIYVDFEGRWLSAAELDVGAFRMLHLMPFTLRVVMDERKIEPLLADLAGQTIPIDVRQLRINPNKVNVAAPAGTPQQPLNPSEERKHDVTVEFRGTVGLATQPVERPAAGQQPQPAAGAVIEPRDAAPLATERRPFVFPIRAGHA
ncbi:MAG: hypothetical protein ACK6CT_00085 [Planctomycetia bacterium]|jgi:hypothetical protein